MTNEIKEVAYYLGIRLDIPLSTVATIKEMLVVAKSVAVQKREVFFDIEKVDNGISLLGTNIVLRGELATQHFGKCNQIVAVLATMGMQSEILSKTFFAENSEKAVVFDACLTTLIEYYLDNIEIELKEKITVAMPNATLTTRISCGYGDLDLSYQKDLLALLRGNIIGVFMNDSYMLTPNKSVIALIGVKNGIN